MITIGRSLIGLFIYEGLIEFDVDVQRTDARPRRGIARRIRAGQRLLLEQRRVARPPTHTEILDTQLARERDDAARGGDVGHAYDSTRAETPNSALTCSRLSRSSSNSRSSRLSGSNPAPEPTRMRSPP